jgi:NCAIR mutase (PurE)-related protein
VDAAKLRELLEQVRAGGTGVDDAVAALRHMPFADLGYALVDHHRALRQGVPEVIYGEGKSAEQIVGIARELSRDGGNVLVTRLDAQKVEAIQAALPAFRYMQSARVGTIEQAPIPPLSKVPAALVTAGTSDLAVAEECAETMRMLGVPFERTYDVGVAGIHRLLNRKSALEKASVVIVVAGMEGALPTAVGGLVDVPVIAVPVNCGYGAALSGFTAMFCALTSCASGVLVCNIDNGFGAAFAAARFMRAAGRMAASGGAGAP